MAYTRMSSATVLALLVLAAAGCDDHVAISDPHAVALVSVSPTAATLVPGQILPLAGVARDRSRNPLPDEPVTWATSNAAVATVSAEGVVEAVSPGDVTIIASADVFRAFAELTVNEGGWIGPAGGTISAQGGAVVVEVPENAVAEPLGITVASFDGAPLDPTAAGGEVAVRFDGTLAQPARITIGYDPAAGPAGVARSAMGVRRLVAGVWQPVEGSSGDPDADLVSAPVTAAGVYGAGRLPATVPCTAPEHRQLDFWLGRWGVVPTGSGPGTRQATSTITGEAGGCAVFELFQDLNVRGQSISLYDPATARWYQTFVDNTGVRLVLGGGSSGGVMILAEADNASRISWSVVAANVRQLGETSDDGGASWSPQFDLTYLPR